MTQEQQKIKQEIDQMSKKFRRRLALMLTLFAISLTIWSYLFYKAVTKPKHVCKSASECPHHDYQNEKVESYKGIRFYLDEDGGIHNTREDERENL